MRVHFTRAPPERSRNLASYDGAPGKAWNTILRLNEPRESSSSQSWMAGGFELVH